MEITQEYDNKIREIMGGIKCSRDFECYRSGFENLSKVEIVGNTLMVECKEAGAVFCGLGFSFGYGYICKCPLRHYIAKHFNR